ncbi:hypothetical protein C3489_03895 [Streptomyces sp. Ru71]|uniref:hypothetical protein n=1 Tax=Streptomyces sp. Ru71 TaxID=2080746 RepID=UPI000CDDED64|nr:hypothetical protein [Streptomyces sp. Ru71]POX56548.1 hypothetical protein C3489_03895 [Streptomyces sp. Ru71]
MRRAPRALARTRVIGALVTLALAVAEIPLAALAFREHKLWAYGLFELLLVAGVVSLAMTVLGDDDDPPGPGGDYQGDGGVGLGI